jgi:OPA family sugar phosphate sensor protein UhpC-like MFS transporter
LFIAQGFCQSTGWAPLTKNVSSFFSQRERGWVMGIWCTNFSVGGLIALFVAGLAGEVFGYRYAFFVPAGILFVIWLLFIILQRNRPEDVGLPSIEEYHGEPQAVLDADETPEEEPEGSWKVIVEVMTSPMVFLLAGVYFFLKPTRYAILFWGPKYVSEKLGSGMAESGAVSALFELAGPVSVFLGGLASDKVFGSKRNPVCVLCLFALAVPLFLIDKLPSSQLALGGCFFLIGLLLYAPDALISGTSAVDFGTKKGASTAVGIINGCGSFGAILGGAIPGFLHQRLGWDGIFTVFACSSIVAGLLLLPKWNALPATAPEKVTK